MRRTRAGELLLVIRADHSAAARKAERLQHAGKRRVPREGKRVRSLGQRTVARHRQAGLFEQHTHPVLVPADCRRLSPGARAVAVVRLPMPRCRAGPSATATMPSTARSCRRSSAIDRRSRFFRFLEANRYRTIAPRIFHDVTAIGCQHHLDTSPPCRFRERFCLVSGGRGEEQDAGQGSLSEPFLFPFKSRACISPFVRLP